MRGEIRKQTCFFGLKRKDTKKSVLLKLHLTMTLMGPIKRAQTPFSSPN